MDWVQHFGPPLVTAFLASLVECVEALTVVLAVGAVLGWRGAIAGTAAALALLLAIVALLGPVMTHTPTRAVHLCIGALLLGFGLRWLHKAVLRSAGIIPLRDEEAAHSRHTKRFRALRSGPDGPNRTGPLAAFQITMVEGIEVVFIVVAVSAADRDFLLPASLGALGALLLVCALGIVLHRPIARIPENALKFGVGVLTCAFGLFWLGEGLGVEWPGDDWSVLALAAAVLAAALGFVQVIRSPR